MKILTLNVRHGGGKRAEQILQHVGAEKTDVVVLTEYRSNTTGAKLCSGLADLGLPHAVASTTQPRANAVMIAARSPLERVPFAHPLSTVHSHRVLLVRVEDVLICGAYFPGAQIKVRFWQEDFIPLANEIASRDSVIIGDFNTGVHLVDEVGRTFYGAKHLQTLADSGWRDAWRSLHPTERDYTWFSHKQNGFRVDHCWFSSSLAPRLIAAHHVHGVRLQGATDHSALVVDLAQV